MLFLTQNCLQIAGIVFFTHFRQNIAILGKFSTKIHDFLLKRLHFQALQALVQAREQTFLGWESYDYMWFPSTINIVKIGPIVVEIFRWALFVPNRVQLEFGPSMMNI